MKSYTLISLLLLAFLLNSCNPECTSLQNITITPAISPETYQVLISAPDANALKGRKVFFGTTEAVTDFVDGLGLVTTVPDGMGSSNLNVWVEDLDCENQQINGGFQVVNENNYFNTPGYISPSPPTFIIPTIPPAFPPSIDNAWLSPQNVDYCLWFISLKDTLDDTVSPPILKELPTLDPRESFEFSTCNPDDPNVLYHNNPISGIIDPQLNIIDITIDRRPNGGVMESYTGMFIDINQSGYNEDSYKHCDPNKPNFGKTGHMMLLTSKTTGRQTIAFQPG